MTKWRIVPYQTKHEPSLLRLEAAAPQGSRIRLEMLRGCFRDRSEVFDQFGIFLAVSESDDVLGVIAGSVVLLERNGIPERVGYLYDLRVARDYRRIGIARSLGAHLLREYFPSLAVDCCISTVKAENQPASRALRRIVKTSCHYPFTYLTIPTGIRTLPTIRPVCESRFRVSGFKMERLLDWVYRHPEGGPALFRTDRAYRLRAVHIAPWLYAAMRALELIKGPDWKLPRPGEEIRFATLFDLSPDNFHRLDDLLEHLRRQDVRYLAVCCLKGDDYYHRLRRFAISSLDYRVVGTSQLKPSDSLTLDVRCL